MDALHGLYNRLESSVMSEWLTGWNPSLVPSMEGKNVLITGGNSGIGFQTARKLAENGAKVFLVSRDIERGEIAAQRIRKEIGKSAQVVVMGCNMNKMENVKALANRFAALNTPLHVLLLNSGVFFPGPFAKTEDNFEQTMAINYYAAALLMFMLLPILRSTPGSRVVLESSPAESFGVLDWGNLRGLKYKDSGITPYGTSKICMILLAMEMSKRVPEVDFIAVQPGLVLTPLQAKVDRSYWFGSAVAFAARFLGQNEYHGSWSTIFVCSDPSLTGTHYGYWGPNALGAYHTVQRKPANKAARSPEKASRLADETYLILARIVGKELPPLVPMSA